MGRVLRRLAFLLPIACSGVAAQGASWELDLDARLADSDARRSFLDGGLGALRYGEDQSGLHLGRARFGLDAQFGGWLAAHLDASSWGDDDKNPVDLTEAWIELRPPAHKGYRLRSRLGAFFPPISLENRAAGWETPYSITPSAINSWVGEELRTIGLSTELAWLGTKLGHDFDVTLTGAVFGWNDPAGGLIASHGFALQDRQTTLFGRVGWPGVEPLRGREMFHEIDHRAGFYLAGEVRWLDRITWRALHYDNRGDPEAYDAALGDFAWDTHFDSAGIALEAPGGVSAIAQWLKGETYIEPPGLELEWPFDARFVLLSKTLGTQRFLSLRYDDFHVSSDPPGKWQRGHAWTAAFGFEPKPELRCTLEWIRVWSTASGRVFYLGEPPFARESLLQLALRYAISGGR